VVVGQVTRGFEDQEDRMAKYLEKLRQRQSFFDIVVLTKIPQEESVRVDALSRVGSGPDSEIKASKEKVMMQAEPSITLRSKTRCKLMKLRPSRNGQRKSFSI
jgi:hypothetical protein